MAGPRAVLFDVDGTLVDSNYLHVHAWQRAFDAEGMVVASWQIHRSIGMDGSRLVRTLSDDAPDDVQERLSDKHSEYYREITPLLQPLPGARDLLHRVADLGLQVVLASSAPEDELEILRKVLDCDDVISETTSSRDVDTAKPEPGIVRVALDRAGVDAEHAVFVGDAVWDAHAAAGAGLPCIGLLSGGIARAELQEALERTRALTQEVARERDRLAALAEAKTGRERLITLYDQLGQRGDSRYMVLDRAAEVARELAGPAGLQSEGTARNYLYEHIRSRLGHEMSSTGAMIEVNGS